MQDSGLRGPHLNTPVNTNRHEVFACNYIPKTACELLNAAISVNINISTCCDLKTYISIDLCAVSSLIMIERMTRKCRKLESPLVSALQMTWWQTNGWTSRLQWLTSCPLVPLTSSPAPSARLAWTTPARGRAAPPTTSKETERAYKNATKTARHTWIIRFLVSLLQMIWNIKIVGWVWKEGNKEGKC